MKKIRILLLVVLILGAAQFVSAQKEYVYDGDDFSVKFNCESDYTEVLNVHFGTKDSNGELLWKEFEITRFQDYDNSDDSIVDQLMFYCIDGLGKEYIVDFYPVENILFVEIVNEDRSIGTKWELKHRVD